MARDDYLPPDLDAKAASARRRQKLAETMLAQSMQPRQGRMAGRIYVAPSPLEGIAQVAQAWAANRAGERADTEIGDIAKEGQQRTTDELARIMATHQGSPGTPTPMGEDPMGGTVDPMPTGAVRPDPEGAAMAAVLSPNSRVAGVGKVLFEGNLKKSENAENRAARLQEQAARLEAAAQNAQLGADARRDAAKLAAEARRDIAELMAQTQRGIAQGAQATQMSIAKLADARWDRPSANVAATNEAKSKIAAFTQAGRVDLAKLEWEKAADLAERRSNSELLLESERAAAARELAELKEIGLNQRWGTVSGNVGAQVAGQQAVQTVRGDQELAAIRAKAEEERTTRVNEKAKPSESERRIADLMASGMPREDAQGVVYGTRRVIVDPVTGAPRMVDTRDGREIKVTGGDVPPQSAPPPEAAADADTLWTMADETAGVKSLGRDVWGRVAGQVSDNLVPENTSRVRQKATATMNEVIRALSINPKFPVAEIKRIREEMDLSPSATDSPASLRQRLQAVDQYMRERMVAAEKDANDATLPKETRQGAASSVAEIRNLLPKLGVPQKGAPAGGSEQIRVNSDEDYDALAPGTEFVGPDGVKRRKP